MREANKKCECWGCDEEGHRHADVWFKAFQSGLDFGGIFLCHDHCKQAKRTGHMDILISGIKMEPADQGSRG